jgi:hypothetical protein
MTRPMKIKIVIERTAYGVASSQRVVTEIVVPVPDEVANLIEALTRLADAMTPPDRAK